MLLSSQAFKTHDYFRKTETGDECVIIISGDLGKKLNILNKLILI